MMCGLKNKDNMQSSTKLELSPPKYFLMKMEKNLKFFSIFIKKYLGGDNSNFVLLCILSLFLSPHIIKYYLNLTTIVLLNVFHYRLHHFAGDAVDRTKLNEFNFIFI